MRYPHPRTALSGTSSLESLATVHTALEEPQSKLGQTESPFLPKKTSRFYARSVTPDAVTERLIHSKSTQIAQQHLHWRTPSHLVGSFLVGVIAAICQHCLYRYLNLRSEDAETAKTSLVLCGRAIAYLAKIAFARCIVLCYQQRIWRTFRNYALSIKSIDQLFSGTEDISLLANWEAISKAPLITTMVLIVWLLPLATVIASPSALTFGWRSEDDDVFIPVPTLNFSTEADYNWRAPVILYDGSTKSSLSYYNTTDPEAKTPGWFDYYDEPSTATVRHIFKNIYSVPLEILNGIFNQEIARQKSCGGGFNCTYSISFLGPDYRCENFTDSPGGLLNKSLLMPEEDYAYYANVRTGDYNRPQMEDFRPGPGGIPTGDIPAHLGSLRFEPELWIGYALNTSDPNPRNSPLARNWTTLYERHIARCILHESNYTMDFNFTNQICQITWSSEPIAPILGFNFSQFNDGILPTDQWLSPSKNETNYKKIAAYHAVAEVFRNLLTGHIIVRSTDNLSTYSIIDSNVAQTSLVQPSGQPQPDIVERLEALFRAMVTNFISRNDILIASEQIVPVHRTRYRVVFIYDPVRLWLCYGPVILLTSIILIIGALTIWQDGTTFSTGFSRILAATRNPFLDQISEGACLGNDPFPEELMQRKVQFGSLQEDVLLEDMQNGDGSYESVGHCAFGDPTTIAPIRRGVLYRGLKSTTKNKELSMKYE